LWAIRNDFTDKYTKSLNIEVIKGRKSKKDRQYNDQNTKGKTRIYKEN